MATVKKQGTYEAPQANHVRLEYITRNYLALHRSLHSGFSASAGVGALAFVIDFFRAPIGLKDYGGGHLPSVTGLEPIAEVFFFPSGIGGLIGFGILVGIISLLDYLRDD